MIYLAYWLSCTTQYPIHNSPTEALKVQQASFQSKGPLLNTSNPLVEGLMGRMLVKLEQGRVGRQLKVESSRGG